MWLVFFFLAVSSISTICFDWRRDVGTSAAATTLKNRPRCYSHPLRRTRFGQYQASLAALGWPRDWDYYLVHKMQSDGWVYSKGCTSQHLLATRRLPGPTRSLALRLRQYQSFPDANTASWRLNQAALQLESLTNPQARFLRTRPSFFARMV